MEEKAEIATNLSGSTASWQDLYNHILGQSAFLRSPESRFGAGFQVGGSFSND